MAAQTVIRGGTVVDGSGGEGYSADVALSDGKIAEIGQGLTGDTVIEADGCVVAPGFIDIHTHFDAQVFWDPALTPSCYHGVTTVVAGNCGFSIAPTRPEHREVIAKTLESVEDMNLDSLMAGIPWEFESFPEYMDAVSKRGTVLNYGAYIGHTALRMFVMGDDGYEAEASEAQINEMARLVREAIDVGAIGFATSFAPTHVGVGGKPIPSRVAGEKEFHALCHAVGAAGKGVVHTTLGGDFPLESLYDLQIEVGRPFTYGALLTFGGGVHEHLVKVNDEGHARGARVWPQVTPRPLTMLMHLGDPFAFNVSDSVAALMNSTREERLAAYADPAWREKALAELDAAPLPPQWHTLTIAESTKFPELEGRRVAEVAAERDTHPFYALLDIGLAENLDTRFRAALANDDEEGVAWLLTRDGVTLGLSDAGAHVGQLCDAPQATDLLGKWVRERELMPIERAIRMLSGHQADIFGFEGRGYLKPGYHADVVVLDPKTVAPGPIRRVRDFPANADRLTADRPEGIEHVFVGGTPIVSGGCANEEGMAARPGGRPSIV